MYSNARHIQKRISYPTPRLCLCMAILVNGIISSAISQTIEIHLATDLGPAKYKAAGFLHGFSNDGQSPPDALVKPLNIQWMRYQPRLPMADRFKALGIPIKNQMIVLSDAWGYRNDPSRNNYADWEQFIVNTVNTFKNAGYHPGYDIWNESDETQFWSFSREIWNEAWRRAYLKIRATDPDAYVCGPSFGDWVFGSSGMNDFMSYAMANNVVPDILCWHFPANYVSESNAAWQFIKANNLNVKKVVTNEFIEGTEYAGTTLNHLCNVERSSFDGAMHACWDNHCFDASLDGILIPNGGTPQKTGKWWIYERYAQMSGQVVETVPNSSINLFAVKNSTTGEAAALFGCECDGSSMTITLKISGLSSAPYLVNNGKVHARVERMSEYHTVPLPDGNVKVDFDSDLAVENDIVTLAYPYNSKHNVCYLTLSRPGGAVKVSPYSQTAAGYALHANPATYTIVNMRGEIVRKQATGETRCQTLPGGMYLRVALDAAGRKYMAGREAIGVR